MVWVEGVALETVTVRAPKAKVFETVKDVARCGMWIPGCELVEDVGDGKFHFRLAPRTTLGWTFIADYVATYTDNGVDEVKWVYDSGNMKSNGWWRISGTDGSVAVSCRCANNVDAQVPRILARPARLFANRETGQSIAKQLKRLKRELER